TTAHIIGVFGFLNVTLITLAAHAWCRVAAKLGIGPGGKWLGFLGLFVNYAVLKWTSFYPLLVDSYGFAIGMLLLWCHLHGRRRGLFLLTAAGAFIWPTIIYQGVLLLLFPRDPCPAAVATPARHRLNLAAALAAALAVCCLTAHQVRSGALDDYMSDLPGLVRPVYPAMAVVALYLVFGLKSLWNAAALFHPAYWLRRLSPAGLLLGLVLLVGAK